MSRIIEIVTDPLCPVCLGRGGTPNPLSRPRTWRRLDSQAFKLVSSVGVASIERFPRAWKRLQKLRNLSRRYQSTKPCPRCAKHREATPKDVMRRLGVEAGHPHADIIKHLGERGLLSWRWPADTLALYSVERTLERIRLAAPASQPALAQPERSVKG